MFDKQLIEDPDTN